MGFLEAAFFPGAVFFLSKWYKRSELGTRIALLYCGNIISNAFGSLVASAILDVMEGELGQAAWRWLFYIEGSLTVFVALCAIFILPDFPSTTRWLSPEECYLAMKRMEEDAGVRDEKQTEEGGHTTGLRLALRDWKVWWIALAMINLAISMSFINYFPTLCATMGFDRTVTLLLCAPPFIFSVIVTYAVSRCAIPFSRVANSLGLTRNWTRHSDATGERFYHFAIPLFVGIIGFIVAVSTMNTAARYVSL